MPERHPGPLSELGDRLSNPIKYVFNLDSSVKGAAALIPGSETRGLPAVSLSDSGDSQVRRVEFIRRRAAVDLSYKVQFSNGLGADANWSETGVTVSVEAIDNTWERVVVEDASVVSETGTLFARVMVELISES